jgi:hypothetical protein
MEEFHPLMESWARAAGVPVEPEVHARSAVVSEGGGWQFGASSRGIGGNAGSWRGEDRGKSESNRLDVANLIGPDVPRPRTLDRPVYETGEMRFVCPQIHVFLPTPFLCLLTREGILERIPWISGGRLPPRCRIVRF